MQELPNGDRYIPALFDRLKSTRKSKRAADPGFGVSARELRRLVLRDLHQLFTTTNLLVAPADQPRLCALSEQIGSSPRLRDSVINYGVPSFCGRSFTPKEEKEFALAVKQAIERFEPRLTIVSIDLYTESERAPAAIRAAWSEPNTFLFVMHAQLWGDPLPEQLTITSQINAETADVQVKDTNDELPVKKDE